MYGLGGLLYGEYDNSGALIREYVYLNGAPLAQVDAGSPEVLIYLHTDHLATPRYGTNAGGSTVWTWDSGAFGKEAATGSATVNLRFPGQYRDAETGLHYNWNRYYSPATGRYVSSDPIGLAGGLNTYSYVSASPVMFSDPRGLDCVKDGGVATCNFPDGPQVSFPAPDGWPDQISSSDTLYHSYKVSVPLKGASASCVMQGIINSPTPGNDNPASSSGTNNNALPTWLDGSGIQAPVKSYVSDDQTAVLNVTEPGHPLFPGYVLRVYEAVDGPKIVNYGEGAGLPQSGVMPPPIPYAINSVWYGETNDIVCSCK